MHTDAGHTGSAQSATAMHENVILRGGGRKGFGKPTERGPPLDIPFGSAGFVPLHNFQSGDVDFRNTCFIAVIVNLRP